MTHQNEILIALRQITRAIDLNSKQLLKTVGLTAPQILVLQSLEQTGQSMPSEIARQVHLSQATVTTIVDRLVKSGLVRREKSAEDRRVVNVIIEPSGRKCLEQSPSLLQDGFHTKFEALKPWEQTLLLSSLQRLAEMMSADNLDAAPILEIGDLVKDT